jgi:proton-dependent oligopeptide transporter, POT family
VIPYSNETTYSYILIAVSEIFASITGLEYAFTKAPKNMRSLVTSVFLFTNAFSAAIGQAWTGLSSDPLLVWNYASVAIIAGIAGTIFWFQFKELDAQEEALNQLDVGHVVSLHPETPTSATKPTGKGTGSDHSHAEKV